MKIVYYVASSLDGFIADSDDGVDWLEKIRIRPDTASYQSFFNSVDGLLMGRKTFDFVFDYGQWPYENKPTWVCSRQEVPLMEGCDLQPEQDLVKAIEAAEQMGLQKLWVVGGGKLVNALIQAGRLTHLSVAVMPILLFEGCPLVDVLPKHLYLTQTSATELGGFTQIEYSVDG